MSPALTTAANAYSSVGSYPITAAGASDPNYLISYMPGTLKITPAPLIITANNVSMVAGAAVPALTMSCTGFVCGDSAACLDTQPTIATPATSRSPAGVYPILVAGACAHNYTITQVNGLLTVAATPVNVDKVSIQTIHLGRLGLCKKTAKVIVVQFSGALNGLSAQNLNCYSLVTVPSGKQKSKVVALSQAAYNPANNTVRLTTRKPLVLKPSLKLTVNGQGVFDSLDRPLGGNYAAILSKTGVRPV